MDNIKENIEYELLILHEAKLVSDKYNSCTSLENTMENTSDSDGEGYKKDFPQWNTELFKDGTKKYDDESDDVIDELIKDQLELLMNIIKYDHNNKELLQWTI